MSNELKSIDFYESELKQVLTIADELAVSLDHLGSWFDTPEPADKALSEYFGILGAGQRVLHLRGVLSNAVDRTLGEDAYHEEREAIITWP